MSNKVALIVLNYNDSENTLKYVKNVENYNVIDKIIVVDNNSPKEGEKEKINSLKSSKVDVVLAHRNGGYAYGNNVGLKFLDENYENDEYAYVIISNPDVYVEEEAILKTIEFLNKNKDVAIASPRMKYINGFARRSSWKKRTILIDIANSTRITELLLYPILKKGEYTKKDYENNILNVDNLAGSFFIARHDIFKKIGYFDEKTFLFYEEDIISEKIKNEGYKLCSLNNIHFMHYDSQTIGKIMNLFKKIDILFNSKIYYHKNYNKANSLQIVIFKILKYVRKFELLFEVPIRKLFSK